MTRTIKYRKKQNKKRKTKHYRRKRGGTEPVDPKEVESLKTIINKYMDRFDKPPKDIPPEDIFRKMKYDTMMENSDKIIKYKNTIKSKSDVTSDEVQIMRDIVYFILEDEVDTASLEYSKPAAGFQNLINNILMYMVNDVEVEDTFFMKLRKRISNGIPYLDVVHTQTGLETSYDVNELFAVLKNHMKKDGKKPHEIIKESTYTHKRNVGPVPKEVTPTEEK